MKKFAQTLLIIGGINWLLVGLFRFDLVAAIFGGPDSILSRAIYTIVGLCALYAISFVPLLDRKRAVTGEEPTIRRAA